MVATRNGGVPTAACWLYTPETTVHAFLSRIRSLARCRNATPRKTRTKPIKSPIYLFEWLISGAVFFFVCFYSLRYRPIPVTRAGKKVWPESVRTVKKDYYVSFI